MSEIRLEEKIRIVKLVLDGQISINGAARTYKVPFSTLKDWIRLYKSEGAAGLIKMKGLRKYPKELKERAVVEYKTGKGSLSEICQKYKIRTTSLLRRWIKQYNGHVEGDVYMSGRKVGQSEKLEIVKYCLENGKDYVKTSKEYEVRYQQVYQ